MSRIKILACGAVERVKGDLLDEVELRVVDRVTGKEYNIECYLLGEPEDGDMYSIVVYSVEKGDFIDSCRLDSSGNIIRGDDFVYDEIDDEFGSELIELMLKYFIVAF